MLSLDGASRTFKGNVDAGIGVSGAHASAGVGCLYGDNDDAENNHFNCGTTASLVRHSAGRVRPLQLETLIGWRAQISASERVRQGGEAHARLNGSVREIAD